LAQTAGLLLWESSQHTRIAVMVSIDRARFTSFARPGDSVRLAVDIDSFDEKVARVRGVATVDERQVAAAALTFSMQEPESVVPPIFLPYFEQAANIWLGRYPGRADKSAKHD
jgi:3-hydroxymyristoyl/3-hydroxydecanoyl-(acyl carrier protein) dehydratase